MDWIQKLPYDLGTYAVAVSIYSGYVTYRANPLRAVNRYFAACAITAGIWQCVVAAARTTGNFGFWGLVAAPFGVIILLMIFLTHDAALEPVSSFWRRIGRNYLAILCGVLLALSLALAFSEHRFPFLFPYALKLTSLAIMGAALFQAFCKRTAKPRVNRHELMLVNAAYLYLFLSVAVFILIPTRLGSKILSASVILFYMGVNFLQFSERVFDAKGTAKIAFGFVLAFLMHLALVDGAIFMFQQLTGAAADTRMWVVGLGVAALSFPIFFLTQSVLRVTLVSLRKPEEKVAREAMIRIATHAKTEPEILTAIASMAKGYLGGIDVEVVSFRPNAPRRCPVGPRDFLLNLVRRNWLTPEGAVRQFKGQELDQILTTLFHEKIAAIVTHGTPRPTLALFVSERAGGAEPIRGDEIVFLMQLASIAVNGIERIRAIEEGFRQQTLIMVGRFAAQFSHEARNQLATITELLGALCAGEEAKLTPRHRHLVFQQAVDLAANHNLALEITRLHPDRLRIEERLIRDILEDAVTTCTHFAERYGAEIAIHVCDHEILVLVDSRLLRQVLLNLLRNGLQAAADSGATPRLDLRAWANGKQVLIEVSDNGPGVPDELRDSLFSPWTTSKQDGTGLGLSFCLESLRQMQGDISYLTPRGRKGACFRLVLPRGLDSEQPRSNRAQPRYVMGHS